MTTETQKSFQPGQKDVRYLGNDFSGLKASLLEFAKTYYPNTYRDFSDASVGMMYMEQAAYVGDVLSYYIDYQFKESLPITAEERKNIIALSKYMGYKPKTTGASIGTLDVYQLIPSMQNGDGTYSPDMRYAQIIKQNMVVAADTNINFVTNEPVDFSVDTVYDPTEISVYQRNESGQPEFYVLKKNVPISSGTIVTKTVTVAAATPFFNITLDHDNVISVLDIYDSDGNRWYESDYMAQDLIPVQTENIAKNDFTMSAYRDSVPFLLKFIRTARRFTTSITADNYTVLEFGSGTNVQGDSIVLTSAETVNKSIAANNVSYDPANFLANSSYGQAPSNTVLTVRYIIGGGTESNVNSDAIKNIVSMECFGDLMELPENDRNVTRLIRESIKVNNTLATTGGRGPETNDEIKANARANFSTQNRAVTRQDYVVRAYAMPAKYGAIAKAYATTDQSLSPTKKSNQFAINLYVLCRDADGRLVPTNPALMYNLRNYLNEYRLLTDGVNIIDGYIINVGLNFTIIVYKNYNKRDVLTNCLNVAKTFLSTENMQFSQPINLSRLRLEIAKVDGVQSVTELTVKNLTIRDGDYSKHEYNISSATVNDIVYPSVDPSVFEVRFPTKDIVGKVV